MADIKSVNNNVAKPADQHIDQLRQKIGTDFTSAKIAGKKNKNEMGKDDFVKLMSAQLKYQDPMSPLKNEEMAAQLAQFSALEQMMNMNQNLEKMTAAQKPQENVLAASLIGKRIHTDSSRFQLAKGAQPELKFNLPEDAETVNVAIVDAKGEVVREVELAGMMKGPQSIRWDAKNGKNQEVPLGEYTYRITATGEQGKPLQINTATGGLVSGVVFEGGKPMLLVDDKKIALETVGRIEADTPAAANRGALGALGAKALTDGEKPAGASAKSSAASSEIDDKSGNQKTTQSAKNGLSNELTPEKIKIMLEAARASQGGEFAATETESESGPSAFPLWNPGNM